MRNDLEFSAYLSVLFSALTEAQSAKLSEASKAGIHIANDIDRMALSVEGFNNGMSSLLQEVVEDFLFPMEIIKEDTFKTALSVQIEQGEAGNIDTDPCEWPYIMATKVSVHPYVLDCEIIPFLKEMTWEKFSIWAETFYEKLSQFGVDLVLGGNFTEQEAIELATMVGAAFEVSPEKYKGF